MARHDEGFFSAKDNLRLFWESDVPEDPKAHVMVVHGYADHCGRYRGIIDHLVGQGYAVHAFDYRGHGQSGGRRGYCDKFDDFLDDVEIYWDRVRGAAGGKKTFVLGHSHGSLISIVWQKRHPHGIAGMVLSSPYLALGLKPSPLKLLATRAFGRIVPWLPVRNEIKPELLTQDVELQRQVAKDPLYNQVVTPRWFTEANHAQEDAFEIGRTITQPLYVFCGSADGIARPDAARRWFEIAGSPDKKFKEYPGMLHECMNEVGREQVWADISGWISAHL